MEKLKMWIIVELVELIELIELNSTVYKVRLVDSQLGKFLVSWQTSGVS